MVNKIKGFPSVHKINVYKGVPFVQEAVDRLQETDKVVRDGCGFNVSKLFAVNIVTNLIVSQVKHDIFPNKAGDGGEGDWHHIIE